MHEQLIGGSPIFTYGGRGTLKPGCKPAEHAIIYNIGCQEPSPLEGETGIVYSPIGVNSPEDEPMYFASRINFGKAYPIEWNVKVKDLGMVCDKDMEALITYYRNENS